MAGSKEPRICLDPYARSTRTPGPLGMGGDAADPSTCWWFVGDTPGPVGCGDHAAPGSPAALMRERSYSIEQAPTLRDLAAGKVRRLASGDLERMNIAKFQALGQRAERQDWVLNRLGRYERQLHQSAGSSGLPVQLLATVILNEMLDIDVKDVLQEALKPLDGSFGIAQIQISTAIGDRLFEEDAAYRLAKSMGMLRPFIQGKLQVPQFAIDAAAKECRLLLDRAARNPQSAWAAACRYSPALAGTGPAIYQAFPDDLAPVAREKALARFVSAAYNSPGILVTSDLKRYETNAITHGNNAATLAEVLYIWQFFRP